MKRIMATALCVLMLLSACAKDSPNNEIVPNSSGSGTSGSGSISEAAKPTPMPTPALVEGIEECTKYGFTFDEGSVLLAAPEENGETIISLDKGSELFITGSYEDFYLVECDDAIGYLEKDEIAFSNGYINADEVKIRAGSSRKSDILDITTQHDSAAILGQDDEWYNVALTHEGEVIIGYVHTDYVSFKDAYTSEAISLRSAPDETSDAVCELTPGKRVSILYTYDNWYYVMSGDNEGFIAVDEVIESPTVTKIDKERAYIIADGVHVREGATTESEILKTFKKYNAIYITGETDEWFRIEYTETIDGEEKTKVGFISREFVKEGKPIVYVTAQDVNLRAGPGTGYDLLTKVRKNSEFVITEIVDNWYKGVVNGNKGYIRGDYLDIKPVAGYDAEPEFTDAEVELAAKVAYLEAKGSGREAYRAVVNVIYNRVKSRRFANNVRDVVYARNQFSVVNHSNFANIKPSSDARKAAKDVLIKGIRPLPFNVVYFHASYLGRNWGSDKEFYKTIGSNSFFRYVG